MRINGTLNQYKCDEILKQYITPFKNRYHTGNTEFMYQYDGCGPHQAKRVAAFSDANGISLISLAAQSPNLNSIGNLWGIMKRRLRMQTKYPSISEDLFSQLYEIWSSFPDNFFIKLSHSMVRSCTTIIKVSGSSCEYG